MLKRTITILALSLSCALFVPAHVLAATAKAQAPAAKPKPKTTSIPSTPKLAAVQNDFQSAERALRYGKMDTYYRLKQSLIAANYPLYPYLQYAELRKMMAAPELPTAAVESFLKQEQGTILEARLREYWLKTLIHKKRWAQFTKDYQNPKGANKELACYDIYARFQQSQNKAILEEAKPLWLTAKSQPDGCNVLFTAWKKQGGLTSDLVWQRIKLAMNANQGTMVNYLKGSLPANEQFVVQAWLSVYRDPKLVSSERIFKQDHPYLRDVQVYGIKKVAKKNIDAGITLWRSIEKKFKFSKDQKMEVYRFFGLELAMKHDPKAYEWFAKVDPTHTDLAVYEWEIRLNLWDQRWDKVAQLTANLPAPLKDEATWIYWHARALDKLGKTAEATRLYNSIHDEREFNGFMAADMRDLPYPLYQKPPVVTAEQKKALMKHKTVARALELRRLGRITEARREWDYGTQQMSEQDMQTAATIAYEAAWYDRAILTLSHAENRDNIEIRFPMAFRQSVEKESSKRNINPAWVYAIVRRESAFVTDAHSPAGASGLMQLMPMTAKLTAKEIGEPYFSTKQLLEADKNIRLGSAYLGKMYRSLNSNIILATAAYNAGPGRVKQWLPPQGKTIEPDIWIENVPFYETREYVKSVLTYRMIYQNHLGKVDKLEHVLNNIQKF